jgi:two-component system CheB/CheR fusion protein
MELSGPESTGTMPSEMSEPSSTEKGTPSAVSVGQPRFVVGVGASAGGLEALEKFFQKMPRDSGLAFVVVQHLSPDHKSFMVELLSKRTSIPVLQAEDGLAIQANTIYLIPPKKNLKVFHGQLLLVDQDFTRGFNLPIDILFRSLAEEKQHQAIGVVLSGTGSDGTMGIRAIKDSGGMVMVQSEATAQFDGMPRSAIGTGLPDFILPPEEMPRQLMQYVQHPFVSKEQTIARDQSGMETLMHKVFALLRERCGVDFSNYKPSTIDRRIARRISINQLNNLEEYYSYLESSPREVNLLFNEILICVTRFFRDREAFEFLAKSVVPEILGRVPAGGLVRVWVPSCSTGEEAYSLAMLFADEMGRQGKSWDVKIFATDIAKSAIETASLGLYSESEVADVPADKLKRYFSQTPEGWQIQRPLRQMVVFARHDLLKDPPFTKLDLVSCRNVLIYFQAALQARVLGLFHFALKPEGILFLGSSETTGDFSDRFQTINTRHKVYRMRPTSRPRDLQFAVSAGDRSEKPVSRPAMAAPAADLRLLDAIFHDIIGDYAPPSLVVDENNDVLHVFGRAGDFLKHPPGDFSNNLLRLTSHNLSAALATVLHRSAREGKEAVFESFQLGQGKEARLLRLRVKPLKRERKRGHLRLVFIEEKKVGTSRRSPASKVPPDASVARRIEELEQDLISSKESLQATIEELETANEELQATNEELQATNEELLAANEQLQSTNEELQSVNEELHTVNVENQNRIEELTELSNDINNLLTTSGVGTILVDETLRLRRVSTAACAMGKLSPLDVGAPLEVLGRTLPFPELPARVQAVITDGKPCEQVITQENGHSLLARILPYRTETNHARGVVLTLIDITERRSRLDLIQGILDAMPARVAVVNEVGELICVNAAWQRGAGEPSLVSGGLGVGQDYFQSCRQAVAAFPEVRQWLAGFENVLRGRLTHFELEYVCPSAGGQQWFCLTADPLPGKQRGLVICHLNITERKLLEAQAARSAAPQSGSPVGHLPSRLQA